MSKPITCRITIADGTSWPNPRYHSYETINRDKAIAYDHLLTHPWGTEVSIKKIRMLRKAMKEMDK